MNEQAETQASGLDYVKLVLGILILAGGIVGFYFLGDQPLVVRWLVVLGGFALGVFVALQSSFGHAFRQFVAAARMELRKVVWPTTQETWRTTLVVFAFVVVMGFFFWFLDMGLAWASKQLTGQGG
jgi:preprotein translocase subunit SecE